MTLAGKRIFVTGGSRGIGLAIALRAAKDGASIAIAAKTAEANPKLPALFLLQQKILRQLVAKPWQFNVIFEMKIKYSKQLSKQQMNLAELIS